MGQFQLNGATVKLGGGTYQLTQAVNNQFGAMWYKLQHDLNNPFNIQGQINLGADPGGADGVVFVMQNNCLSVGSGGGGLGYFNMPGQSIGIEFDTYQNIGAGSGVEQNNDPVYDHIAFEKNGDVVHSIMGSPNPNDLFGPVQMDPVLTNLKTGLWYNFKINYDPVAKLLTVYFNNSLRISVVYDLQANVFTSSPWVYWGFTSSTGGHNNIQEIQLDTTYTTHILQDTTICSSSIPVTLDPFTNLKGTNLALNNPIHASSNQSTAYQMVDGNIGSRWESVWNVDPQWVFVDLQSPTNLDSITIDWEGAYATSFLLQTSNDSTTWTTVYSTTTNPGGHNKIPVSGVGTTNIRYVRIYGTTRSLSAYGYSIWEFKVYGQPNYLWSTNNGTNSTISPNIYSSSVTLTPTATTTYSVMIPDPCLGFTTYNMTITVDCALPVELTSFNVVKVGNKGHLTWTTSLELNASHFNIMKSLDGIHFVSIGRVDAIGNSHTLKNYYFDDNDLPTNGTVYYQLVTTDIDGSSENSVIKLLNLKEDIFYISNPVFDEETSLIIAEGAESLQLTVVDAVGRILLEEHHTHVMSPIYFGKSLPPTAGFYVVIVQTETLNKTFKVIKRR
ncbi:MAG: discoidin domain-containing protein [Cytophagaceae bacterium]|nr:discoidin domain-containing protein [Cytophagaceae bacterium]